MSEPVRFYLDEHVHSAVAAGLRRRGIDVPTTQEAEMLGASDEAHIQFALTENRVIFTQDDDFLKLHARDADQMNVSRSIWETFATLGFLVVTQVYGVSLFFSPRKHAHGVN